jgi:hypothetical protein
MLTKTWILNNTASKEFQRICDNDNTLKKTVFVNTLRLLRSSEPTVRRSVLPDLPVLPDLRGEESVRRSGAPVGKLTLLSACHAIKIDNLSGF